MDLIKNDLNIDKYIEYVVKLNEILDKLQELESNYIIEYQKYKEKKHLFELEALEKKKNKELKTLKDVEVYIYNKILEEKSNLTKMEAHIKYLQYEKQKLQNIIDLIKTSLILDKRIEKEIEKTKID